MSETVRAELDALRGELARLQRSADIQEVIQTVMSYGPLVDSGSASATAALWDPHGDYVVDDLVTMNGRDEIAAMVDGEMHQEFIASGAAHVLTVPRVVLTGSGAEAFNHCLLLTARSDEFSVTRASACHWVLARSGVEWNVLRRTNRLLNGQSTARQLFARLAKF